MKLLQNKVAIITGASRGIGKGIAEKFAEQGCNIAFTFLSSAIRMYSCSFCLIANAPMFLIFH